MDRFGSPLGRKYLTAPRLGHLRNDKVWLTRSQLRAMGPWSYRKYARFGRHLEWLGSFLRASYRIEGGIASVPVGTSAKMPVQSPLDLEQIRRFYTGTSAQPPLNANFPEWPIQFEATHDEMLLFFDTLEQNVVGSLATSIDHAAGNDASVSRLKALLRCAETSDLAARFARIWAQTARPNKQTLTFLAIALHASGVPQATSPLFLYRYDYLDALLELCEEALFLKDEDVASWISDFVVNVPQALWLSRFSSDFSILDDLLDPELHEQAEETIMSRLAVVDLLEPSHDKSRGYTEYYLENLSAIDEFCRGAEALYACTASSHIVAKLAEASGAIQARKAAGVPPQASIALLMETVRNRRFPFDQRSSMILEHVKSRCLRMQK
jgi:hypothetical protein